MLVFMGLSALCLLWVIGCCFGGFAGFVRFAGLMICLKFVNSVVMIILLVVFICFTVTWLLFGSLILGFLWCGCCGVRLFVGLGVLFLFGICFVICFWLCIAC